MEKKWAELSPEEKREDRFKRWLSPPDVEFSSPEAEKAYKARVTRLIKVIKLEEPDRVPVMLPAGYFPAFYAGWSLEATMYDYDKLRDAWLKFMRDFAPDGFDSPGLVFPGKIMEKIDYKLHKWPGHGLPSDAPMYQFVESEYMKAEEYDDYIQNPSDFWMRVYLPRIVGAFEAFQNLARFTPNIGIPMRYIMAVGRPDVQAAFQALLEAGRESVKWQEAVKECGREAMEAGFPSFRSGVMCTAPFDMIGDSLRGTRGIMTDMFRQPDKLHEAMEKITPMAIKATVAAADDSLCPVVFMPLHKGNDSFMSGKQFETFYWPTFKKVLMGLINEGLVPMPFAEGSYQLRLEIIKEMPRGAMIWYFEQMDMARAKEVLGDNACIAGNVPTSVLCTGTPQDVKEYCRKLIEVCGQGGGYILAGASSMNKGNPDNLRAMMEAAREYGVYK